MAFFASTYKDTRALASSARSGYRPLLEGVISASVQIAAAWDWGKPSHAATVSQPGFCGHPSLP